MKHLKTFESFNNQEMVEEGSIRGFLTGHGSYKERKEKKEKIMQKINNFEKSAESTGKLRTWVNSEGSWKRSDKFDKQALITAAEENNWKGDVVKSIKPDKNGIYYVGYSDGKTPLHKLFSGGGGFMQP